MTSSAVPLLYIDTNIIIRYLTQDNPEQSARAKLLLDQVALGNLQVTTSETIIGEVVFVLSSKVLYNVPRQHIRTLLSGILMLRGMKVLHKRMYLRALDLYATTPRLDFADAFSIAYMERHQLTTIVSFDKDFDGIPSVLRQEP